MSTEGAAESEARQARTQRRKSRQRAATRALIVEAALALIDRDGMEAATLDAIAAELGLTKQGLYYHFESKEALLADIAMDDWSSVAHEVDAATRAAPTAADAIEALVRTYVDHYAGRVQRFRLATQGAQLSREAAVLARSRLSEIWPLNELFYGATERKLREGQAAGEVNPGLDPRRLAFVAHLGAMGLLSMKLMVSAVDDPLKHRDEQVVAELCRALRAGL